MKIQDSTVILETLDEVDDVFWGPTNWDFRRGGSKCGYYAAYHCLSLPESQAKNCRVVKCATVALTKYWDLLGEVETGFAPFDFYLGKEDTKYEPKTRELDNPYLLAAKHISEIGIDNFYIEIANGNSHRGVKFTNKETTKSFTFKDTIDHDLTTDALNLYFSRELISEKELIYNDLQDFIQRKSND
jgi:hypothetical protein